MATKRKNTEDDPLIDVDYEVAMRVMDWHGGQGTDAYALGSTAMSGRPVPRSIIEGAAADLRAAARKARARKDKRDATNLAYILDAIAEGEPYRSMESDTIYEMAGMRGKQNPKRRMRNTHDAGRSARAFRSSMLDAGRELAHSPDAAAKGDVAGTIQAAIAAAYHLGRAACEATYAHQDDLDPSYVEQFHELRKGLPKWGESLTEFFQVDAAANPRRSKKTRATRRRRRATNPPPRKYRLGQRVAVEGTGIVGVVQHYSDYDDELGTYRVRVREDGQSRAIYFNEGSLRKIAARKGRRAKRR